MGKWEHGHEGREGTGTRVRRALGRGQEGTGHEGTLGAPRTGNGRPAQALQEEVSP